MSARFTTAARRDAPSGLSPWRHGWVLFLCMAMLLHLGAWLVLMAAEIVSLLAQVLAVVAAFLGVAPVEVVETVPRPPSRTFIITPEREPEEVADARYEAATATRARDNEEAERPDLAPHSTGPSPVAAPIAGVRRPPARVGAMAMTAQRESPPLAKATPPPAPSLQPAPAEVASRSTPPPAPSLAEESELPLVARAAPAPKAVARPSPSPPERPPAEEAPTLERRPDQKRKTEEARPRRRVEFQPAGERARAEGKTPEDSAKSSSRLKGNKAFEALAARYPAYMAEVKRRIDRQLFMNAVVKSRSYRAGRVVVAFGIKPNGSLGRLESLSVRDEMLAEGAVVLDSVKAAAPFGPMTTKMLRDRDLFGDIGLTVLFY